MITKEKLHIYKVFNGDIDGWVRVGTKEQKATMEDADWYAIDGYIQDFKLLKKGLASEVYLKNLFTNMSAKCDNEETILVIKKIADES